MKSTRTLHLEPLEDRTTPSTLSISFVPDGTQVGAQQSRLFQDLSGVSSSIWQPELVTDVQAWIAQPANVTLAATTDDGASLNAAAPQDGAIRVAAVDQAFDSDGTPLPANPGGYLVVSGQGGAVTFGAGLGLIGPDGNPVSPSSTPLAPTGPTGTGLPLILPMPRAFGGLYPTAPSGPTATMPTGPTAPTTGPTATTPTGPTAPTTGPTATMPTGPTAPTTGPTATLPTGPTATLPTGPTMTGPTGTLATGPTATTPTAPTGPTSTTGPTGTINLTVSFVPDGTWIGTQQSNLFQAMSSTYTWVWETQLLNDLQAWIAEPNVSLTVVPDDGASLNAAAPEDGAIRIAAVDQVFSSDGASLPNLDPGNYLVVSGQGGAVTFGTGLGLIGPNGNPVTPSSTPLAPTGPTGPGLPLILPIPRAFGGLYPTAPTGPTGTAPTTGPTATMPTGPTATMPTGPTATMPTGPTATTMPSFTMPTGPTGDMPTGPTGAMP